MKQNWSERFLEKSTSKDGNIIKKHISEKRNNFNKNDFKETYFIGTKKYGTMNRNTYFGLSGYLDNYVDIVSIFSKELDARVIEKDLFWSASVTVGGEEIFLPMTDKANKSEKGIVDIFRQLIISAEVPPSIKKYLFKTNENPRRKIIDHKAMQELRNIEGFTNDEISGISFKITKALKVWVDPVKSISGESVEGYKHLKVFGSNASIKLNGKTEKIAFRVFDEEVYLLDFQNKMNDFDGEFTMSPDINSVVPNRKKSSYKSLRTFATESNEIVFNTVLSNKKVSMNIKNIDIDEWYVLTDEKRKGSPAQREFVRKAMGSGKFSLLTGPPGTGKTTTIVELILQIMSKDENARILVTSETHVAVDNVLEQIVLKFSDKIDHGNIYRNGKSQNTNLFPIVNSSIENARVIGSTLGSVLNDKILQSKKTDEFIIAEGNIPSKFVAQYLSSEFDYVIIDEASKTTLADFMQVISLGKRVVVAGDEKQLPPTLMDMDVSPAFKWFDRGLKEKFGKNISYKDRNAAMHSLFNDMYTVTYLHNLHKKSSKEYGGVFIYDWNKNYTETFKDYIEKNIGTGISFDINDFERNRSVLLSVSEFSDWEMQLKIPSNAFISYLPSAKTAAPFRHSELDNEGNKVETDHSLEMLDYIDISKAKNFVTEVSWRKIRAASLKGMKNLFPGLEKKYDWYNKQLDEILESHKKIFGEHENKIISRDIAALEEYALNGVFSFIKNRIENIGDVSTMLEYQYRMKEDIAHASKNIIYGGTSLLTDINFERNDSHVEALSKSIFGGHGAIYKDIDPYIERGANSAEAGYIAKDLSKFKEYVQERDVSIMIICFHHKQINAILNALIKMKLISKPGKYFKKFLGKNITLSIHTVDDVQGKEADFTLISFGVSIDKNDKKYAIGFTDNPNRMNVCMTRAKTTRVVYIQYNHNMKNHDLKEYVKNIGRKYEDMN